MTDNNPTTEEQEANESGEYAVVSRDDLEAVADGEREPDEVIERETSGPSRRAVLEALGLAGAGAIVGSAGMATLADPGEAASGGLGEQGNALEAAYLAQLDGPIVDEGAPIKDLVNIIVAEEQTTVSPSKNTLIIRYTTS